MVLRIRLARFGKRNAPFYNIVVAQARYVYIFLPHVHLSLPEFDSSSPESFTPNSYPLKHLDPLQLQRATPANPQFPTT